MYVRTYVLKKNAFHFETRKDLSCPSFGLLQWVTPPPGGQGTIIEAFSAVAITPPLFFFTPPPPPLGTSHGLDAEFITSLLLLLLSSVGCSWYALPAIRALYPRSLHSQRLVAAAIRGDPSPLLLLLLLTFRRRRRRHCCVCCMSINAPCR